MKEKYGAIYFDMAQPISAKQFFRAKFNKSGHNLQPIHQQEITEEEKKLIPELAHEIVLQQQKHCVITTFNLIAIVLHHNLFNEKSLMGVDDLCTEVLWLKKILEAVGAFVQTDDVRNSVFEALEVHKNIVRVDESGKVTLVWNQIVLDKANIGKLKAHNLSETTLTTCVPFIMLQLYINPVLHYLVDCAILVAILKQQALTPGQYFCV